MEDGRIAALPSLISRSVETLICSHRRERKVLLTAKPANWEQKLEAVNAKTSSFVYDLKQNALATSQYLKRSVSWNSLEKAGATKSYISSSSSTMMQLTRLVRAPILSTARASRPEKFAACQQHNSAQALIF